MLPFVAVTALLLSGPIQSQESDPPKKTVATQPKDKTAPTDNGKALAELKKDLETANAALKKDLDAAKKEAAAAATAIAGLKTGLDSATTAAAAAKAEATAAKTAAEEAVKKAAGGTEVVLIKEAIYEKDGDGNGVAVSKVLEDTQTSIKVAQNSANTAWMLTSAAFVLLMVPGLALFYGGMVRRKNVLATLMQSMAALAVVGVYWIAVGYSLAFGPSVLKSPDGLLGVEGGGGLLGWSWDLFFLKGIAADATLPGGTIPVYLHMVFQGMFAIITPALISGAIAERIRFWPFCIFMILWVTFVYCPLAHMVWAFDNFDPASTNPGGAAIGLLGKLGALDFAGGTVVHIAAGLAGLACCIVLGKREGYPKTVVHPNSMVLTLVGAGLLWFGWFGFNGGSAVASNALASSAFTATQAAAAAAGLGWMLVEWIHKGKPTALGLASGIVAGLVAVTPAAGFVPVWGGLAIGAIASVICYIAVMAKGMLGYDDSLDAFGVHGIGGFVGAILTGVFAFEANKGWLATGETGQTIIQIKAAVISVVFAFVVSLALCALVQAMTLGNFRTSKKDETLGLDQTEHGESGFDFGYASESFSVSTVEPRAASVPKGDGRFELGVEGATSAELMKVWSALCQPTGQVSDADFLAVYPYVTTIRGSKFRCRGGNASSISQRLEALFKKHLPGRPIKVVLA